MIRDIRVFKTVKDNGNRYYRIYSIVSEVTSEITIESSCYISASQTITPSSYFKNEVKCEDMYSNKTYLNKRDINIIVDLSILDFSVQ